MRISSRLLASILAIFIVASTFGAFPQAAVAAGKFSVGDTVEVYNTLDVGLKVRDAPAGERIGVEYDGTLGMVLDGPTNAALGGIIYTWWKIRYEDGLEGWSAEGYPGGVDYLKQKYVPPSTKFDIGDPVRVTASILNIRTAPPELAYKGEVHQGDTGEVRDGPFYGVPKGSSGFYYFWKIDYGGIVGWSAENWLEIKENLLPTCSVSAEPRSGNAPLTVTFSMSANDPDGSISAWVLDVDGDGNADYSGSGSPPSTQDHTYTSDGAYSVVLLVSDNEGASASDTETVNVSPGPNDPPTCSLSPDQSSGVAPLTVTFTLSASDSDGSISSWALDVGDGSGAYSGSGSPPSTQSHTYTSPGSYTAVLMVSDNEDATASDTQTISVSALEQPSIGHSPFSFTFTATEGGSNPGSQTLGIWNSGGGTMRWSVTGGATWLALSPASGTSTGETDKITVSVDISGMSAGGYSATITIADPEASNTPQTVPVSLTIEPPAAPDVPSPPQNLRVTDVDSSHVKLDWDPPLDDGGSPLTSYKLYRGTSSGGESFYDSTTPDWTSYDNTANITPDTTYYYYVTAVNAVGEGNPSSEVNAYVPPAEEAIAPSSLHYVLTIPFNPLGTINLSPKAESFRLVLSPETGQVEGTTYYYKAGTSVTLTAEPASEDYVFSHWKGNEIHGSRNPEEIVVESDRTVAAYFKHITGGLGVANLDYWSQLIALRLAVENVIDRELGNLKPDEEPKRSLLTRAYALLGNIERDQPVRFFIRREAGPGLAHELAADISTDALLELVKGGHWSLVLEMATPALEELSKAIAEQLTLGKLRLVKVAESGQGEIYITWDGESNVIWVHVNLYDPVGQVGVFIPVEVERKTVMVPAWENDWLPGSPEAGLLTGVMVPALDIRITPIMKEIRLVYVVEGLVIEVKSPVELKVYDSHGRVTGAVAGEIKEEIPNSSYSEDTVTILSPSDSYHYEVTGVAKASYSLTVTSIKEEEEAANQFILSNAPVSAKTVHQYTIDWQALSEGQKGVTMKIDSDGDGAFERTIRVGREGLLPSTYLGLTIWGWLIVAGLVIFLILVFIINRRLARA